MNETKQQAKKFIKIVCWNVCINGRKIRKRTVSQPDFASLVRIMAFRMAKRSQVEAEQRKLIYFCYNNQYEKALIKRILIML